MVCFYPGGNQMLYLFVMDSSAVKDPPPAAPQVSQVNKLEVASWTREGRTYVLAGPKDLDFQKLL